MRDIDDFSGSELVLILGNLNRLDPSLPPGMAELIVDRLKSKISLLTGKDLTFLCTNMRKIQPLPSLDFQDLLCSRYGI